MDAVAALVLSRGLERVLVVAAGTAALWMGWKLFYRAADSTDHSAEFSFRELVIKLQSVAPGTVFALFGAAILTTSVLSPITIEPDAISTNYTKPTADQNPVRISYWEDVNKTEIERYIAALNTAIAVGGLPPEEPITEPDRALLLETLNPIEELRNELLKFVHRESDVAVWLKYRREFPTNPNAVPERERAIVAAVQKTADQSIDDIGE